MKHTLIKKAVLAAAVGSAALIGIATTADAQWRSRYYAPGAYYSAQPYGYYDEDAAPVYVAPRASWYGYGSPGRDTACIQDRRDFAERTNFICR